MHLEGTPSDQLPGVLATGETSANYVFMSFSTREPEGRDAEYIEWHTLDHRPEQHRLPELRQSLRLVSTPACRAVRAADCAPYDAADHIMNYLFTGPEGIPAFNELGRALHEAGRMPLRLPSVVQLTADLAGKSASPQAVAGADVIPWRPSVGVYLIIEQGNATPASLIDVAGVAGVWWYIGNKAPAPYDTDARNLQISYCYLDKDPVEVAQALKPAMLSRWKSEGITGLLAAPFYCIVPYEWERHLP